MKNSLTPKSLLTQLLASTILFAAVSSPAENVFITGWKGLNSSSDKMPNPPVSVSGFASAGAGNASASQVSPAPIVPNNARRIHYGVSAGASISFTPTNVVVTAVNPAGATYTFTALQNVGVYKIYLTKGQDCNASTNIIVQMTATENSLPAQLADTNGVAATTIDLDMFQKGKPNHVWVHVGYITNTTPNPTVTLTHISGSIADNANVDCTLNQGQRWYTDAIRFEFVDSCAGVAGQVSVTAPLGENQSFVDVTDVAPGATNVTVYANGTLLAETNNLSGFAGGNLTVNTPLLAKGDSITAGQTKNGCSSLVPATGPAVGGGPNAQLRASLACWKDPTFTGPAGANTLNPGTTNYFLKATSLIAGFGTAPTGGATLTPGVCWQTVTFDHSTDIAINSAAQTVNNTDPFCALAGVVFAIDSTDSGPYDIYIDRIMNGDLVIENFEGYPADSVRTFSAPNQSSTPNPVSTYLAGHSLSTVSQIYAFDGTNACRMQWQWSDGNSVRWAQILANASTSNGKYYPQLDVSKPITVRYLVLPVGDTVTGLSFDSVPASQSKAPGETVTFNVSPRGESPFTYQWKYEGADISGATSSSYSKSSLQVSDSGLYSVVVTSSGDTPCTSVLEARLTVAEVAPTLSYNRSGNQITFTWSGSFTLQSNTDLMSGSWSDVSSASGYAETINSTGAKFFRLRP